MLRTGIIGFGGLGHVHATHFAAHTETELAAVADRRAEQFSGHSMELNIGTAAPCDMNDIHTYLSAEEMLEVEDLDVVSVCLPTDLHTDYVIKALEAGCHVICEKPMSRTLEEADAQVQAQKRTGKTLMIAQCLRFWPCYERLAQYCQNGELGRLLMLSMRRVSAPPGWGGDKSWFMDGARSGGALLDMHVHDTDFANWVLGLPSAVMTTGGSHLTGAIDNAVTQYVYENVPAVVAETSWSHGGGFRMSFCAIFEQGTLEMGYGEEKGLCLFRTGKEKEQIELPSAGGHEREIAYFIDCVLHNRPPQRCMPFSTRETMRIALAEEASAVAGGKRIEL